MTSVVRVLIWGAGGHGRVVADAVVACGFELVGFVDARPALVGSEVGSSGVPVLATESDLRTALAHGRLPGGAAVVVPAVGHNATRKRMVLELEGRCSDRIVHPSAIVSPSARISKGTVVLPGGIVNSSARIGRGVIVNSGAVVEHDCSVGDGAHLSPGAVLAGGVSVGECSWVGANATILPGVRLGHHVTVGAGAVVRKNVEPHATVVGNPARIIHYGNGQDA